MRRVTSPLLALLLLTLFLTPLARYPSPSVALAQDTPELQALEQLPTYAEVEAGNPAQRNDSPTTAEHIGAPADQVIWTRTITGTIDRGTDVDYFRFVISRPASRVRITLSDLPADYDLVFGGGLDPASQTLAPLPDFDAGIAGLEGITQVGGSINSIGGSINSIGGSINSIGGSINSIGGSINSIGGSINSIGGSINSISINTGTTPEAIDTFVWQPGVYFVAVAPKNGVFSPRPYTLDVTVEGSALSVPPAAPRTIVTLPPAEWIAPEEVTTLYLYYPQRLGLQPDDAVMRTLTEQLQDLANAPPSPNWPRPEYGVVLDLSQLTPAGAWNTETLDDLYRRWDQNPGNPLYANYIARFIDKIIKSAIHGTNYTVHDFVLGDRNATPVRYPNVRNIVLVGGDDVFPFFRLPDLTTIANESDYFDYTRAVAGTDMFDPAKPLGAALRYRMILSDNPYGTDRPYRFYGAPLFLPNRAVGRLVESPAEISAYLQGYAHGSVEPYAQTPDPAATLQQAESLALIDARTSNSTLTETLAFVSGYDFLIDQAEAIRSTFTMMGITPTRTNALINDTWQSPDLEREWFAGRLAQELPENGLVPDGTTPQIRLNSVNAHFDHWQVLPANEDQGTFLAQRLRSPQYGPDASYQRYFAGTLGYSVGCHSGYNVPASALSLALGRTNDFNTYAADFPQAKLYHGGNWIGNTGYGYGITDGIDYSERLAVLLTEELARNVTFDIDNTTHPGFPTIGDALMLAKQRYLRNASSLNEYDYKILSVMNLYGLPFVAVAVDKPLAPPQEDPAPERPNVPVEIEAPLGNASTGRLTRLITFTLTIGANNYVEVPRTSSRLLQLGPDNFVVTDSFVLDYNFPAQQPRVFSDNQVGAPALPSYAYDISALNQAGDQRLRVRDVMFVGGTYGARADFKPQITQIVTETEQPISATATQPLFTAGAGLWFPAKFFGHSSVGTGDLQRDQLFSFAAQFRANEDGATGVLRPYSQMVFRILYDDPSITTTTANNLRADNRPPEIEAVHIRDASGELRPAAAGPASLLIVTARDKDGAGNTQTNQLEVAALFAQGGTNWVELPLTPTATNPERFTVELPESAASARFIVRATDPAGNSSYFTAGGRFTTFSETKIFLPLVRR
ncbi:MAG: peptidase [Candidatus Viridilinea halotolerans]|uniref:Peptidase n=1 Tax=Candidatus Viridilinea halotolerans TaxID=2491704 RepID=A0A426TS20_9CHLR|nr:MAG: peptidase [Candidatus Viridilinea halotolerans]